jgi:hypothetical protein
MKGNLSKRGKGKYKVDKTIKNAYSIYLHKFNFRSQSSKFNNSVTSDLALTWLDYKKVVTKCLEEVSKEVLYKSKTFVVPYKLGIIRIQKKRMNLSTLVETKNLKIDWGYYQKTGKIIKHLNEDRDGYRYKFYWLCKKGPSGKTRYKFEALRERKRELAKIIKTTNIDYFE